MSFQKNILTNDEAVAAAAWNREHSPYKGDLNDISILHLLRNADSHGVAIFQDNNGYGVDGHLTQKMINRLLYTKYRKVTYYSSLPEYHVDMQLVHDAKQLELVGDIMLIVCGYDGLYKTPSRMSKRYGDVFGLDTGTVGWPHFAASTLAQFIQYLVDNYEEETKKALVVSIPLVDSCSDTELERWGTEFDSIWFDKLKNKRWIKANVKDGPHNEGIFVELWWRRFLVQVVRNKILRQAQTKFWLQDIFIEGLSYFNRIGLETKRGLAICVRYRNSQKMGRSVIRAAKRALRRHGEDTAIEVIFKYYERYGRLSNKTSKTRGYRISRIRKSFNLDVIRATEWNKINKLLKGESK